MLTIRAGLSEDTIDGIDSYFQFEYEDEWFHDPLVKEMVLDIDHSVVEPPHKVVSPVLGDIPVLGISTGVKALILMYKEPENEFWATACGDNCAKWIVEIGKRKELTINLHHVLDFSSAGEFDALMLNTGRMVHGYAEYLNEALGIKER